MGLHGVLGDVWDSCWDVYDAEVHGAYRVLRGGGWFDGHSDMGFRVARSVVR
ncbi:hypothetical protein [Streptomyces canus]|uniref:hypothetical protein n=1 Tax=Streptomyces canus TaxID=58343 RepID=UPI0036E5EEE5